DVARALLIAGEDALFELVVKRLWLARIGQRRLRLSGHPDRPLLRRLVRSRNNAPKLRERQRRQAILSGAMRRMHGRRAMTLVPPSDIGRGLVQKRVFLRRADFVRRGGEPEGAAQAVAAAGETGAHRADRYAQNGGGLLVGHRFETD